MRVWVDLTNSPHVLVFRPLVALLRERGHEVEITAREYAQTMQLLELHGIDARVVGHHGGASTLGKARAELSRVPALKWPSGAGSTSRSHTVARPDPDRPVAGHPERHDVRQ
jgi:predicted glycosyltransferase